VLVTEVNCLFSVSVLLIPCVIQCVVVVYNSLGYRQKVQLRSFFQEGLPDMLVGMFWICSRR